MIGKLLVISRKSLQELVFGVAAFVPSVREREQSRRITKKRGLRGCALIVHERLTQGPGGSHPWAVVGVAQGKGCD